MIQGKIIDTQSLSEHLYLANAEHRNDHTEKLIPRTLYQANIGTDVGITDNYTVS
jgi:hypothetical protein